MLSTASASQLGSFIHSQEIDSINAVVKGLYENDSIFKVAVYQRDGTQLTLIEADELPDNLRPVVADTYYQDQKNGYLTLYFSPDVQASLISQVVAQPVMIWIISGLSWGLLLLILSYRKIRRWWKQRKPQNSESPHVKETVSHNQLIRQLLKHSNGKKRQSSSNNLIVIMANWDRLNENSTHKLLTVFNRWLPRNHSYYSSFKQSILVLARDTDTLDSSLIVQLRVLFSVMQKLKLEPTILVHNLELERDIYDLFFEVIDEGIWLESGIGQTLTIETADEVEITIESDDEVVLHKIPKIEAQQKMSIERQVRFLLGE